jgi:uncharacterized membrane protein YecN with MAPEG domain
VVGGALWFFEVRDQMPLARALECLAIISATMLFCLWLRMRNNLPVLRSFRITIDEDKITRRQLRVPDLTIARSELVSINRIPSGLVIRSKSGVILAHSGLESFDTLLSEIGTWAPIQMPAANRVYGALCSYGTAAVVVVALAAVLGSENRIVHIAVGTPLIVTLIGCFVVIQRSKYIDRRAKLISWLIIIGPLPALVSRVAAALLMRN